AATLQVRGGRFVIGRCLPGRLQIGRHDPISQGDPPVSTPPPATGRQPWLAVVLSLFAPGLGHLYGGQIVKALVLFCAFLLLPPLVVIASWLPASTAVLVGLLLAVAAALALDLYALVGAYPSAPRPAGEH